MCYSLLPHAAKKPPKAKSRENKVTKATKQKPTKAQNSKAFKATKLRKPRIQTAKQKKKTFGKSPGQALVSGIPILDNYDKPK